LSLPVGAGGLLLAIGCSSPQVEPLVPGAIENTPLAALAGTAGLPTPGPTATPTVAPTRLVPPPEPLTVPPDFYAGVFAEGVGPVRTLAVAPNGDVFASVPRFNQILALPDRDRDGQADQVTLFAEGEGLNLPSGLVFADGSLYVANTDGVVRYAYRDGDLTAAGPPELVQRLPAGGDHWARDLARGGDGLLYAAVGGSCNACPEADPLQRGVVLRFGPTQSLQTFSLGLRDVGGLDFQPLTGALWATDSGRTGLSDDVPPDELNLLTAGADFGWPRCFGDRVPDGGAGGSAEACAGTVPPAVPLQGRSEPLGISFARGTDLPPAWRDDLFVAFHGHPGRRLPAGYKIGRVEFEGGLPTGQVFDFVTGWLRPDTRRWGSPTDIVFAPDGALLIADDGGERVYRVHYDAPTPTPTPIF
jgi:glucose/arabinose dehydrogenase